jgi:Tol biopolymer transport system component
MLETTAGSNQLALLSVASGTTRTIKTFDGGQYHFSLSPDAALVAFDQPQAVEGGSRDIFVMSTDDGVPHRVIEDAGNDLFPLWTRDGQLLFVSDRTGSLALWAVRIADGKAAEAPRLMVRDVGRLADALGLTADGALFYRLQNGMVDVYVQSIHPDYTPADGGKPVSPTLIGANISSEWSHDGRQLAYVAMRGLVQNDRYSRVLVIRDTDTGRERDLRPSLSAFIEPRWSPDGRKILVRGADGRNREGLFLIDLASGQTREAVIFPGDSVYPATFQWSADGSAVWYDNGRGAIMARNVVSGREQIVVDYKKESIQRLTQWPGFRVSHDGNSVAYTGMIFQQNRADTVVVVRKLGGRPHEIARATSPERVEFQDGPHYDSG